MSGAPTATAAGGRTFFRSTATAGFIGVAFDPDDGRISTIPMPSRGAPSMVEAGRRDAASAGKTMMVPMLNSLWLPL